MSKYSKEEQTEIVRLAMNLEAVILAEKAELKKLNQESFKSQPKLPIKKQVNMNIAPVKPDYSKLPSVNITFTQYLENDMRTNPTILNKLFATHPVIRGFLAGLAISTIGMVLGFMFNIHGIFAFAYLAASIAWFGSIAYYFMKHKEYLVKIEEYKSNLMKSPLYIQSKEEAEAEATKKQEELVEKLKKQQQEYDAEYNAEVEEYENVILPEYKNELSIWNTKHDMMVQAVTDDLNTNIQMQEDLYAETCLISKNNRSLNKLVWLYEDMSTSEHDIERATDLLNADAQLSATKEVGQSVSQMQDNVMLGMQAIFSEVQAGNSIQEDVLDRLGDLKRSVDRGNIIATAQRHGTNKQMKKFSKEFEEFKKKFE